MSDDLETKLSAARTRLILDRPFLGALVLRMPMVAADARWCPTIGTDARAFYYNPDYISGLSLEQTQFELAHQVLHCALSHFARREHRVKQRWDVACDLAINPILIREGMEPAPNALYNVIYEGMMAEEIYPLIKEDDRQQPHDRHLYDNSRSSGETRGQGGESRVQGKGGSAEDGEGREGAPEEGAEHGGGAAPPRPLNETEREQLAVQWRQRLAGAAQQALQAGKLSGSLARLVDHLLQPQLPWRMLLARYVTGVSRDDYSYMRPSRREGAAIMPTLRSSQIDVVIVVDTSGSISDAEMRDFLSEIDAIKGQVRARVMLHACDAELSREGPWLYEPWEDFALPHGLRGGGGTRFTPVFEWIDREGLRPDLLVYFTDGAGEFPRQEPAFPVIWLIKGRAKVPWGQRIQLN
jgi:predicted metal-dependent peptidase